MVDIDKVVFEHTFARFPGRIGKGLKVVLSDVPKAKKGNLGALEAIDVYAALGWLWFTVGGFAEAIYLFGSVVINEEFINSPMFVPFLLCICAYPAGKAATHCVEYYRIRRQLMRDTESRFYKPIKNPHMLTLAIVFVFAIFAGLRLM